MTRIFLNYAEETQRVYEQNSIQQTRRIVDSTLAVVLASYAVKREMAALADIDGSDPFRLIREFDLVVPPSYQGAVEQRSLAALEPGWFYLAPLGLTCYKARFATGDRCFRLTLEYDDVDGSGRFDSGVDAYRNLRFVELPVPE